MQPRPTAAELLADVAALLERDIVPALSGPVQHQARVAASLVGIVERELRLAAGADAAEAEAIAALLGVDPGAAADLAALRAELAAGLRAGLADASDAESAVWQVLFDAVRADLAIVKPGHDEWQGD